MRFSKSSIAKIRAGQKTATTRKPTRKIRRPGRTYNVNPPPDREAGERGRNGPAVGKIKILSHHELSPYYIVTNLYHEEGFDTPAECRDRFDELGLMNYDLVNFYKFRWLG